MKDSFHIQWHITNSCNLRCKHCYQEDFSNRDDLDWSGIKKISNNIFAALQEWDQKACIHLTGGEPLLRPELFPLLEELDQKPAVEELGIITNGLLINQEMIRRLSGFQKLKKVKISLDGGDAETNDSIRREGTFGQVMQNLPLVKKEGRFETIFMLTVMKKNLKSLPSLLKLSQDLCVDGLIIERFIPLGSGKASSNEVLSKEEWKEMVGMLLNFISTEGEERSLLPYQAFQISFTGEEPELLGAPCVIGRDGLCIMPEGTVFPCRRFPVSIGNLLNVSLKQIWQESEILAELRRKENLKGNCGKCEMEECRGCRSLALALSGDYLAEDPHCQYPQE